MKNTVIRTCPEAHSLNLDANERKRWIESGWRLVNEKAYKTLIEDITTTITTTATTTEMEELSATTILTHNDAASLRRCEKENIQRALSRDGYSEGGRLTANMIAKKTDEG